jgi:quinol monooxygenase YgiN
MSLVEIVRIPVAPDDADLLARVVLSGEGTYLAAPRCERFDVLQAVDRSAVVVVATWASRVDHDAAAAEPGTRAYLDEVAGLAAGEPQVAFLTPA